MRLFFKKTDLWLILSGVILALGCRGSMPFGRTVQITKSSDAAEIKIDTPEQRLATGKPNGEDEPPLQDVEAAPTVSVASASEEVEKDLDSSDLSATALESDEVLSMAGSAIETPSNVEESKDAVVSAASSEVESNKDVLDEPESAASLAGDDPTSASADQLAMDLDGEMSPSELLAALDQYPPSVREKAVAQFVQMVASQANRSNQPNAVEDQITRSLDSEFEMPSQSVASGGERPSRLVGAEAEQSPLVKDLDEPIVFAISDDAFGAEGDAELTPSDNSLSKPDVTDVVTASPGAGSSIENVTMEVAEPEVSVAASGEETSLSADLTGTELAIKVEASTDEEATSAEGISQVSLETVVKPAESLEDQVVVGTTEGLSQKQLLAALILSLQKPNAEETELNRHERLVKLSHLMVLAGDPESAMDSMSEMGADDQSFLRHQLKGLWHLIDPEGHPSPSHRLTSVASEFREAAKYAGAATDALEVRKLTFCKEIEAYGQVKPFEKNQFQSGQQVILYCEVENFRASQSEVGYELHLQGSYEIFDSKDQRVFSQILPADQQVSSNYLRDYFVAYQMFLPAEMKAGHYRLQLTMEDVIGKKYGQSEIHFEIEP